MDLVDVVMVELGINLQLAYFGADVHQLIPLGQDGGNVMHLHPHHSARVTSLALTASHLIRFAARPSY